MYRLRYAERKVYIFFDAHPISGVFFVWLGILHPMGCFLFFAVADVVFDTI